MTSSPVRPGDVVIVDFGAGVGREQSGSRPAVVVSAPDHLRLATGLALVAPCTSAMRGWRAHVEIVGDTRLTRPTFAMTEQVRTVSVSRIRGIAGSVHPRCLQDIAATLRHWVVQPPSLRH